VRQRESEKAKVQIGRAVNERWIKTERELDVEEALYRK